MKIDKPVAAGGLSLGLVLTAWIGYWGFTTADPRWAILVLVVPMCLVYAAALVLLFRES